ncbi:N-acetylmuramoyl-L-alanine amidase [Treponema sp.]
MNKESVKQVINRHRFTIISFIISLCFSAWTFSDALPLEAALDELGALLRWDPLSRSGALELSNHRLSFSVSPTESQRLPAVLDGSELLFTESPFLGTGGQLFFPESFIMEVRAAINRSNATENSRFRIAAILIDPGHGGKDSGALGSHVIDGKKVELVEKNITLTVAKDLYKQLSSAFPDKRVLITRDNDSYPSLEQRVAVANAVSLKPNEAIVFISVHANASFNKKARGYEVWYLSPEYRRTVLDKETLKDAAELAPILNAMLEEEFTTESIMMAQSILNQFNATVGSYGPSRGLKAEEWFVVRNARMPSVLVELGFVTNSEDARLLADPAYLQKLSNALYKGTVDFVATFERFGGFTAAR